VFRLAALLRAVRALETLGLVEAELAARTAKYAGRYLDEKQVGGRAGCMHA
jgi:hypothetical protein